MQAAVRAALSEVARGASIGLVVLAEARCPDCRCEVQCTACYCSRGEAIEVEAVVQVKMQAVRIEVTKRYDHLQRKRHL